MERGFTLPDSMRDMVDGGIPRERGWGEVRGRGGRIVEGRERETEQIAEVGPHGQETNL